MALTLGVDLGHANSALVLRDNAGRTRPIRFAEAGQPNGHVLPSVVAYPPRGHPVFGVDRRPWLLEQPQRLIGAWKRLLGLTVDAPGVMGALSQVSWRPTIGPAEEIMVDLGGGSPAMPLHSVAVSFFSYLRSVALDTAAVRKATIALTHPACYEQIQVDALAAAAELAGWDNVRMFPEPLALAAALASLGVFTDGPAVLCDLGAGKFEVSVVEFGAGSFTLLATEGEPFLGCDDMDDCVVDVILQQLQSQTGTPLESNAFARERAAAALRAARPGLTDANSVELNVPFMALKPGGGPVHGRFKLERALHQQLLDPFLARIGAACGRALEHAGLDRWDIRGNVLATQGYSDVPAYGRVLTNVISAPRFVNQKLLIAYGATLLGEQAPAAEQTPTGEQTPVSEEEA